MAMSEKTETGMTPPISTIDYHDGELAAKQGDYGIAVYKVLLGGMDVYTEHDGIELIHETLVPGHLYGEDNVLYEGGSPYPASVRALEETRVEVWHVARLRREFEALPPLIRFILEQPMKRLTRARNLLSRYEKEKTGGTLPKEEGIKAGAAADQMAPEDKEAWAAQQRRFYRKDVDQVIEYKSIDTIPILTLKARLRDISRGGIGMEISSVNLRDHEHKPGDNLDFDIRLPDGAEIRFIAQITHRKPTGEKGWYSVGLSIVEIGYESQKKLGFFLMP